MTDPVKAVHRHDPRRRQGRRLLERNGIRKMNETVRGKNYLFGIRAVAMHTDELPVKTDILFPACALLAVVASDKGPRDDPIADLEIFYFIPHLFYRTGNIAPGDMREWDNKTGVSPAHKRIDVIHTRCMDTNKHFILTRHGIGKRSVLQYAAWTVLIKKNCVHCHVC